MLPDFRFVYHSHAGGKMSIDLDPIKRAPRPTGFRPVASIKGAPGTGLVATVMAVLLVHAQPALADGGDAAVPTSGTTVPHTQSESNVTLNNTNDGSNADNDSGQVNDSYQPKGIQLGQFLFLPKVETEETYNSNVFATQVNVKDDLLTTIHPEINLRSQFTEHELDFVVKGDQQFYQTYSQDDQTNGEADLNGRYDFSKNTQGSFLSQAYSSHEDRSSPDPSKVVSPTPVQGLINRANIKSQFDRFSFVGEVEADRLTYDDVKTSTGSLIPNTDRNRWELSVRERGAYEMFPGYAAVMQVTENTHIFDKTEDRYGYDRGSTGYRAETGIGVDVSKLIRGDFLLGYFQQSYNDSRLTDAGGLSMRAVFNWTPTKLTIIVPTIDRTVSDTTTAQASAYDRSSLTVTVRHELQRNIILSGFAGLYYDQYTGVQNQDDITYDTRARVTYAFNSNLYVGAEVGFQSRHSEADLQSFDQLTSMVKLGVQY